MTDHPPPPAAGRRPGTGAVVAVGVLVALAVVAGVAMLGLGAGVTYLGTTAETRLERIDTGEDGPAPAPPDGPLDAPADVPAVDLPVTDPVPGEPAGTPGTDPGDHCPPPEEALAAAGIDQGPSPHAERVNPVTFDINGVVLVGALCDYGTARVGRWPDAGEDALPRLLRATGDAHVTTGGLDVPSVRFWRAPADDRPYEAEITRAVYFEVDGELYSVGINGGTDAQVDALAGLVLARLGAA